MISGQYLNSYDRFLNKKTTSSYMLLRSDIADKCDSFLYSEATPEQVPAANRYAAMMLGNPDEGSEFDHVMGHMKFLFRNGEESLPLVSPFMSFLHRNLGYDALLMEYDGNIVGHTAYQVHDRETDDPSIHVFSVYTHPSVRGRGMAAYMQDELIEKAPGMGVYRMRLGAGGHTVMSKLIDRVIARQRRTNVVSEGDNWIRILKE